MLGALGQSGWHKWRASRGALQAMKKLRESQRVRYQRQLVIPEIGEDGQKRLLNSSVLVVGAGGLGSPVAYYLAAAGVGKIGLIDSDRVELSNLQRQILHFSSDLGMAKVLSARSKLENLNPEIEVLAYPRRLETVQETQEIVAKFDVIVGAVDNYEARYLLNDACVAQRKPLIEGGVLRWEGMIMTILPGQGPCYRCLFPAPILEAEGRRPEHAGVIGVTPGVIGTLQAAEALKLIIGAGQLLVGRLLVYDGLNASFNEVEVARNPNCPVCGEI